MEIRVLRYFLTVAREESITRAAEVLHITSFTEQDEAEVKALTMGTLLNPRAYRFRK